MVNNQGIVIHKLRYKTGRKHDYIFTYIKRIIQQLHKKLLMYLPLDAFLGIETDFPDPRSSIPIRKKRDLQKLSKEKSIQQKSFQKENIGRSHYLQIEKVQDNEQDI